MFVSSKHNITAKTYTSPPIMLTLSAASTAIAGYLAKIIKDNKSIHDFFGDFTDAAVAWIRPIFLKDGDVEKNILKELKQNPDDTAIQTKVKTLIENQAEDDNAAMDILAQMVSTITQKMGTPTPTNQFNANVTGNQNTVIQGVSGGSLHITNNNQQHSGTGDIVAGDKVINNANYYGSKPLGNDKNAVWKAMLHKGDISEALEFLMDAHSTNADKSNTLTLLLSRHARNEAAVNKGITSDTDANLERNRIINAILEAFGKE